MGSIKHKLSSDAIKLVEDVTEMRNPVIHVTKVKSVRPSVDQFVESFERACFVLDPCSIVEVLYQEENMTSLRSQRDSIQALLERSQAELRAMQQAIEEVEKDRDYFRDAYYRVRQERNAEKARGDRYKRQYMKLCPEIGDNDDDVEDPQQRKRRRCC